MALPPHWLPLWQSFELAVEALGRSPRTIENYRESAAVLAGFLAERGPVPELTAVKRRDLEEFIGRVLATRKPATAAMRYRALHRFFGWLADEGEITESPMARMHMPAVKLDPPKLLSDADVQRLLDACRGNSFENRRDAALIRFLIDTGCRRGEVAGMRLEDLDLRAGCSLVRGKTGTRVVGIGKKTAAALDRYLRIRGRHPYREARRSAPGSRRIAPGCGPPNGPARLAGPRRELRQRPGRPRRRVRRGKRGGG